MRRFISYLALSIGALAMVGFTFASSVGKANPTYEYASSKAFTYSISGEDLVSYEDAQKEVSEIFAKRLETTGLTGYTIDLEGDDQIKVTLSEGNNDLYEYTKNYLTINGSFAFGTKNNVMAIGDEFMNLDKDAYLTFNDVYPTVVMPVNPESAQFKSVIEDLNKIYEENDKSSGDDEEKEKENTYLYVMTDYKEGDLISEIIKDSADYDESKSYKSLMQFVYTPDGAYYNKEKTEMAVSINIGTEGHYTANDLRNATALGNYFVNSLNACEYPCSVTFLYEETIAPAYESIISYSGLTATPAMTGLLIGTLVSIVFVSLILALFYHWGALAVATTTICSTYLALITTIFFNVEFSLAAVVGLIAVALVGIASGIILFTKIKEECYRGRSLKKANTEGHKKALLPIVDIHVVLLIVGIFVFVFGGAPLAAFAATCVFGSIISFLFVIFVLKLLTWLLTNSQKYVGKYEVIGCSSKHVPNIINEEKQNYYGPYQDKQVTKHSKPAAIVCGVLGLVAIAGSVVFGIIGNGALFNHNTSNIIGQATFETTASASVYDASYVSIIMSKCQISLDNGKTYKQLEYSNVLSYDRTVTEKDESDSNIQVTYNYIVTSFKSNYSGEELVHYVDSTYGIDITSSLDMVFSEIVTAEDADSKCEAVYRSTSRMDKNLPNAPLVIAGLGVAVGVLCLYFALRYGLSRAISVLGIATITSFLPIGVAALTRMQIPESFVYAAPFVGIVTFILAVIFFNKDKEMAKEDFVRTKDNSASHREEIMKKSTALAFAPALLVAIIAIYLCINFAGLASKETMLLFILSLIGSVAAIVFVTMCMMPIAQVLFKKFEESNIRLKLPHKNKKKNIAPKHKSAEPEEAIFIGIND